MIGSFTCARTWASQSRATVTEKVRPVKIGMEWPELLGRKTRSNAATRIMPLRTGANVVVIFAQRCQKNAGQRDSSGISRLGKNDPLTSASNVSRQRCAPQYKTA